MYIPKHARNQTLIESYWKDLVINSLMGKNSWSIKKLLVLIQHEMFTVAKYWVIIFFLSSLFYLNVKMFYYQLPWQISAKTFSAVTNTITAIILPLHIVSTASMPILVMERLTEPQLSVTKRETWFFSTLCSRILMKCF